MRIWERAFIEDRLRAAHGPARVGAARTAYTYGFEVDEIVELSGLTVETVRAAILGSP